MITDSKHLTDTVTDIFETDLAPPKSPIVKGQKFKASAETIFLMDKMNVAKLSNHYALDINSEHGSFHEESSTIGAPQRQSLANTRRGPRPQKVEQAA
jgi:hypothetical protein